MKTLWRTTFGRTVILLVGLRLVGLVIAGGLGEWPAVVEGLGWFLAGLVAGGAVLGLSYQNRLAPDSFMRLIAGVFAVGSAITVVIGTPIAFAYSNPSNENWSTAFFAAGILPVATWIFIKVTDGTRKVCKR